MTISSDEILGMWIGNIIWHFFLKELVKNKGSIDIKSFVPKPTWSNRCIRDQGISKHLDRFFLHENLVLGLDIFHS